MNVMETKIELGKKYKLARAVVKMEDFSVAELVDLTSVSPSTVGHFVHELDQSNYVSKVSLPANGRGRPRKSYRLAEGGRKHLLNYMHRIRLQLESNAVPFPDAEVVTQETSMDTLPYPIFTGHEAGASYFVCAALPGLRMKDLVVNPQINRVTVQATRPAAVVRPLTPRNVVFAVNDFIRNIDLPANFGKPIVQRQTMRNGIFMLELRRPSYSGASAVEHFTAAKKTVKG